MAKADWEKREILVDWNAIPGDSELRFQTTKSHWLDRNPYLRDWSECLFAGWANSYENRRKLVRQFAWGIPSDPALEAICGLAAETTYNHIVEIGAGQGYWLSQLHKFNDKVQLVGYDREPHTNHYCEGFEHFEVRVGGPDMAAEYPHSTLFLCWPPYDTNMASEALRTYFLAGGRRVAYVGEWKHGCTADDEFFDQMEKHWELEWVRIPRWDAIHDKLVLARR